MKKLLNLTISLFAICLIASFCLGYANSVTKDKISQNNIEKQNEVLSALFTTCEEFKNVDTSVIEAAAKEAGIEKENVEAVFSCSKKGELKGYIVKYDAKGFGGTIVIFSGFDMDGNTVGAKILSHSETPGLGAKTADENFISQFAKNLSADVYKLVKGTAKENEISAVSGATISSKAVTTAVNNSKALALSIIAKGAQQK